MSDSDPFEIRFAVLDHAPVGQLLVREDFTVLFWNRCLESWTSIDREGIIGENLLDHFPHLGQAKYLNRLQGIFRGGPPAVFSSQLHSYIIPAALPGSKFRFQYTVVTAVPDQEGNGFFAMFAIQDVTSLTEAIEDHQQALQQLMKEMEERQRAETELVRKSEELKRLNLVLKEQAIRDGLTGLFNHRHFCHMLRRDYLLALRHGTDLTCLLLDIDFFKDVNDTFGHLCGDRILSELAARIQNKLRDTDGVARYGGEEFALLLPNTGLAGGLSIADQIRELLATEPFLYDGREISITCSVGVASLRDHLPPSAEALINFADRALYLAKGGGRNQTVVYTPLHRQASG